MPWKRRLVAGSLFSCIVSLPVSAGFASKETFLPAIGRGSGNGGLEFFATVWATNLSGAPVHFTFDFLKQGQANTSPATFDDTLAPGQTKVYENVVESRLGLTSAIGAARVTADGEILLAERIYNQSPGTDLGATQGLFFAGVPRSFSISVGQSASIQGIDQGGGENFHYNFALVETGGGSPTVNVQLFDGNGALLGQKAYILQPYEQLQPNVAELSSTVSTTNARITATVTGGTGSVLLAGAQLAVESLDSSGFEMSFRDDLLGGGGTAGVTSLNGLTGALTIAHGANTTVNINGSTITIDAVSGSGTGLTAVAHDNSLAGSGTVAVPLGIANGQVVRSLTAGGTTLHDNITLAAGNGISVTPSGSSIQIAYTGGGSGGLTSVTHDATLTGTGTGANPLGVAPGGIGTAQLNAAGSANGQVLTSTGSGVTWQTPSGGGGGGSVTTDSTLHGNGTGGSPLGVAAPLSLSAASGDVINGQSTAPAGSVAGVSGVVANSSSFGVHGHSNAKSTDGYLGGNDYGVYGVANDDAGFGVEAHSNAAGSDGYLAGKSGGRVFGVHGVAGNATTGVGVLGEATTFGTGVEGIGSLLGVVGLTSAGITLPVSGVGVFGGTTYGDGVVGQTDVASSTGVQGVNTANGGWGVYAVGNLGATGVKPFVEPHPTDPSREIRYVCLEGPEAGTYFRGQGHIVNGFATIEVPDHFRMVSSEEGMTVQLTPVGDFATLVVKSYGLDRIVVAGSRDVAFFYTVNGIRRAFAGFEPISENRDFVPRSASDTMHATGLPAESVRRLKASGILNPDGSINLETAHRMGWDQRPGWNDIRADPQQTVRR